MSRFIHRLPISGAIALISLGAPALSAQSSSTQTASATAELLDVLARDRANRWAASAPSIRCAPAPLIEQPGTVAQQSRPAVVPLEAAFLDAATIKRVMVARLAARAAHQ